MYTPRTYLRKRDKSIMESVIEMSREQQHAFFGPSDDNSLKRELDRIRNGQYDNFYAGIYFDIILQADNRVIGSAGFHTWWRDHDHAELGYSLNNEGDRRKGYMNEVLPILLKYGFESMQLNRIQAHTAISNKASIALLEKYKFIKEATIHGHYKMCNGRYENSELYYLLKE